MYNLEHKLFIIFSLLSLFGSNSQMAPAGPAAAGNSRLLELGSSQNFDYTTTVLLNEAGGSGKSVGYRILSGVDVSVVWESSHTKLLKFALTSPRLQIQSRAAPEPEGFITHKSQLENFANSPFLAQWEAGFINNIYLDKKEDGSLKNLKKGITSLFQFQILDGSGEEIDASGKCHATYHSVDPHTIIKTKTSCLAHTGVPYIRQPDPVLSTNISSHRTTVYVLSDDSHSIKSIQSEETHTMTVVVKPDAGSLVSATHSLTATGKSVKLQLIKAADLTAAVKAFEKSARISVADEKLSPEVTTQKCSKDECSSLPALVKEFRDSLQDSFVGTVRSANAFIKLLDAGRTATKDELNKAFKGSKNKEILLQLCDLAGAINNQDAHEVMKKLINFESEEDLDKTERYLWAISVGSHPKIDIIKDLFKISQRPGLGDKVSETLVLTVASLAKKFRELPGRSEHIINEDVRNAIATELEECKTEECKHKNLRALRNLLCNETIPLLIRHALNGKAKTSVEAMKTLRAFRPNYWNDATIDAAQKIYFQAGRKYDSSSRTLALDILLESSPRREVLAELIESLLEWDAVFEVKQYLTQRLLQISSQDRQFADTVALIRQQLREKFNNYHVRAQRGLTTAFTRPFARSGSWNGSLVNVQEVSGGLLKRGIVDVVLGTSESSSSVFTLGLFAGGLSSFVSSDSTKTDSNEEPPEEEVATAGMELSVLGTKIRPFVFFSGQSELMGHVWSGTASEKTPAFQALIVSHDHLEYITLQNGLVAQLQLHGAVSFDLSGQIQMSLWNRNAHSLVEQNAGISLQGRAQVDTSFVKSQIVFNVGTEVRLNLISDLNFYNGVSLCMQLVQPDATLTYNVHKIERIIGSKHKLRKSRYRTVSLPGKTYMLNQKNNDMCNIIFKDE